MTFFIDVTALVMVVSAPFAFRREKKNAQSPKSLNLTWIARQSDLKCERVVCEVCLENTQRPWNKHDHWVTICRSAQCHWSCLFHLCLVSPENNWTIQESACCQMEINENGYRDYSQCPSCFLSHVFPHYTKSVFPTINFTFISISIDLGKLMEYFTLSVFLRVQCVHVQIHHNPDILHKWWMLAKVSMEDKLLQLLLVLWLTKIFVLLKFSI